MLLIVIYTLKREVYCNLADKLFFIIIFAFFFIIFSINQIYADVIYITDGTGSEVSIEPYGNSQFSIYDVYCGDLICDLNLENSTSCPLDCKGVTAETTKPDVNLLNPVDNSFFVEGNIDFFFNVTDNSDISSCTLYLGSKSVLNTSSIIKGISNTITTNQGVGTYLWHTNCTDVNNNIGNSSFRTITLTQAVGGSFGGGGAGIVNISAKANQSSMNISIPTKWLAGAINQIKLKTYYKYNLTDFDNWSYNITPDSKYFIFRDIKRERIGEYSINFYVVAFSDKRKYYLDETYNFNLKVKVRNESLGISKTFVIIDKISKEKETNWTLILSILSLIIVLTITGTILYFKNPKIREKFEKMGIFRKK